MKLFTPYSIILICLFYLNGCAQNKTNCTLNVLNYKIMESNKDYQSYLSFVNSSFLSYYYNHRSYQNIQDTLHCIVLSDEKDKLYVYNFITHDIKEIILNKSFDYPIHHIYYHNHDSIFIFYDRAFIHKYTDNLFDFILISRTGKVTDTYSLGDIEYIYKGKYNHTIEYNLDMIYENRIIENNLIITFSVYDPFIFEDSFIDFHPKQLALYNLSTKTSKMLNVKFPLKDIGKHYDMNCFPTSYYLFFDKDNNMVISFTHSNLLYMYDFEKDTLNLVNCEYDYSFENIDSTAWVDEYSYTSVMFKNVHWDSKRSVYFRDIVLLAYKKYIPSSVLEVLDSSFNHMGYLLPSKEYDTPFYINSELIVRDIAENSYYNINLSEITKRIAWSNYEEVFLTKKITQEGGIMSLDKYLSEMQIPKKSIIIIINLTSPCGYCLEYLFTKMKENKKTYKEKNIYYVLYDDNGEDLSKKIIDKYNLNDFKNIKLDNSMLQTVNLFGKPVLDYKYKYIDYQTDGETVKISWCTFEELIPLLEPLFSQKEK